MTILCDGERVIRTSHAGKAVIRTIQIPRMAWRTVGCKFFTVMEQPDVGDVIVNHKNLFDADQSHEKLVQLATTTFYEACL